MQLILFSKNLFSICKRCNDYRIIIIIWFVVFHKMVDKLMCDVVGILTHEVVNTHILIFLFFFQETHGDTNIKMVYVSNYNLNSIL